MNPEAHTENRRLCSPGEASDNVKIDPEFETLIPPLSPSELTDLHHSLDAEQGCHDALIVWKDHDLLVDGHNRIRYCREKGYPFPVTDKDFADRDAVKAYIIEAQLGRRNLSAAAESYLRGKRYLEAKRQGQRTDLTSGQSGQKWAATRLGEAFGVGEKTIRRDRKFAEAVDQIVGNCGSEAKNLLLLRDTPLTRGGVLRLAKLGPEEQQRLLTDIKEGRWRPRKPRPTGKRTTLTVPAQPKALARALLKQLGPEEVAELARVLAEAVAGQGGTGRPKKGKRPRRTKPRAR